MKIEERYFLFSDGEKAIIRSAGPEDALPVKTHREVTASETHFMAREPEDGPMNLQRITEILDAVEKDERDFMVTAFIGDEVIGDLGVTTVRPHVQYLHRGYLGMSIRQKYTGMGLGSFMMHIALEQAQKNGFKEYGINPRAFKLKDGTYCDEIIMANIFELDK